MKIRCSAIGKIMTMPRSKSEVLSQTTKSYIQELAVEHKYGYVKEINSRYLDKGNECEDEAIELVSNVFELGFLMKNEQLFENDYIIGTPDVIMDDHIIDTKVSWSAATFPWFDQELPNKDYYWQMQGYLALTGKEKAVVIYCLVNTPEDMVIDEIRRTSWAKKEIDVTIETENFVRNQHDFDRVPMVRRVRHFEVYRDTESIDKIYERVELCREYYNEIMDLI